MTCPCCVTHTPKPYRLDNHHVIPAAWGGPTTAANLIAICPTTHENIHQLLNEYQRINGVPPWSFRCQFNAYAREKAAEAWAAKPANAPPVYACPHSSDRGVS